MNIITRTQYSIDDGKTWGNTEQDARGLAVSRALDELLGASQGYHVMRAIRKHPDALITALRDMGALPDTNTTPDVDVLTKAASDGEFHIHDERYLVLSDKHVSGAPVWVVACRRIAKKEYIRRGELRDDEGQRYAVVPVEQHETGREAIEQVKAFARGMVSMAYSRGWCEARDINWRDD